MTHRKYLAELFDIRGDARQASPAPPQDATQPPGGQQPSTPPVFRTGINFVRVDVIVSDSKTGQSVADLKQSDFQVTEDNKPQTVETFKLVKLDGGRAPGPDGPPQAIRSDSVQAPDLASGMVMDSASDSESALQALLEFQ